MIVNIEKKGTLNNYLKEKLKLIIKDYCTKNRYY